MIFIVYNNAHMNTRRLNITLPIALVSLLRDKPNKSAFIAQAVAEKLAAEGELRRRAELAEAYRLDSAESSGLVAEWDAVSGDGL